MNMHPSQNHRRVDLTQREHRPLRSFQSECHPTYYHQLQKWMVLKTAAVEKSVCFILRLCEEGQRMSRAKHWLNIFV